ncbi:MAG: 5-(carboxyamino)imidazole ribonucleotide mutase [Salinisphaera sp.]|nr:5-(carboxyamino)imidazole ribonucleotide mutase [Salinisphaera sp.]
MSDAFVAILMGSDSDLGTMEATAGVLAGLEVRYEMRILSAHRTPEDTAAYVREAEERGARVFVCAAGLAAHLAGAVAAQTLRPVIGVPLKGALEGMDSLLSTVQMPGGVPVATVAIGKPGAKNAGYLAAQILGVADSDLAKRLVEARAEAAEKVRAADAALQRKHSG